jgi:hypothetical protein
MDAPQRSPARVQDGVDGDLLRERTLNVVRPEESGTIHRTADLGINVDGVDAHGLGDGKTTVVLHVDVLQDEADRCRRRRGREDLPSLGDKDRHDPHRIGLWVINAAPLTIGSAEANTGRAPHEGHMAKGRKSEQEASKEGAVVVSEGKDGADNALGVGEGGQEVKGRATMVLQDGAAELVGLEGEEDGLGVDVRLRKSV